MDGPVRCSGMSADPVRREGVRRPARLAPLPGGTLPRPSSSDTRKAHDEAPGTAQGPLRVMLLLQVKRAVGDLLHFPNGFMHHRRVGRVTAGTQGPIAQREKLKNLLLWAHRGTQLAFHVV